MDSIGNATGAQDTGGAAKPAEDTNSYVLVLNSGSSSLKFALYTREYHECVGQGSVTGVGQAAKPTLKTKGRLFEKSDASGFALSGECANVSQAVQMLLGWLETVLPKNGLAAVGHRVVHGGTLKNHCKVTPETVEYLRSLTSLAPLHQPYNLAAIEQIMRTHPRVPQVACMDTIFHATMPVINRRMGLPRKMHDKGIMRYGFHGLSYVFIAGRLERISPQGSKGRAIVAHLGSGSSMCAMKGGKSFDTTLGFSTLDGLMMGTRPGTLDAGVILYLLQEEKMDAKALEKLLYKESGLLGVSGISADMITLQQSQAPEAKEAIDLYCHRIIREAGALISVLGGIDCFVFTGGMGEHAPTIRTQVVDGLKWAGLEFHNRSRNASVMDGQESLLSPPQAPVEVWEIPTDEEAIIVRHTCKLAFE